MSVQLYIRNQVNTKYTRVGLATMTLVYGIILWGDRAMSSDQLVHLLLSYQSLHKLTTTYNRLMEIICEQRRSGSALFLKANVYVFDCLKYSFAKQIIPYFRDKHLLFRIQFVIMFISF